jgi:hypothetical protein
MAEDKRFELLWGCPNTLSNNVGVRSPRLATARDLRCALRAAAER